MSIEQLKSWKNRDLIIDNKNVSFLLLRLSIPAFFSTVLMSLCNITDAIFLGKMIGSNGITAVTILFPLIMIVGAIGQMIGIGGASMISRSLGNKNVKKASIILGNVVVLNFLLSIPIVCVYYFCMDLLLMIFGASKNIIPHVREYYQYIGYGFLAYNLILVFNNVVKAEGMAKIAMITTCIAFLLNVVLDAILLIILKMGIRGAAIATVITYIIILIYFIVYFYNSSILKLNFFKIKVEFKIQKEIVSIGISVFFRQLALGLLMVYINKLLAQYGGQNAITIFGIIMRIYIIAISPLIGIANGFQPIAGFYFGAKKYFNFVNLLRLALLLSTTVSIVGALIVLLLSSFILNIFINDYELIRNGNRALFCLMLTFPTLGVQLIGIAIFQAIGNAGRSFILVISRQLLFLIPITFTLSHFFGIHGVWISFPISDVLSTFLTIIMIFNFKKKLLPEFFI